MSTNYISKKISAKNTPKMIDYEIIVIITAKPCTT